MKAKSFFFSLGIIWAIIACEEKDATVLEGDIHGRVSLVDWHGNSLTDRSGVQVKLTGEDTEFETTTDIDGHYIFQGIPFGNFHINLIREKYIEQDRNLSFGHIGGDTPTLINPVMNGIPEFSYSIDSMIYDAPAYLHFYMHTIGQTKTLETSHNILIHFFFSQSPDVSCENYENSFVAYLPPNDYIYLYWVFLYGNYNFLKDFTGTVHCRVYPQAYCNYIWYTPSAGPHPIYPETLGTPSEVFSFTVEGITRTNPDL